MDGSEDYKIAAANQARYQYGLHAGHREYIKEAKRNDDMYLGGGRQWSEADRIQMRSERRPMIELNHVLPAVNTALGLQLHSRVDMDFRPRSDGADDDTAAMITKVIRQICDDIEYSVHESWQFEDGLIEQRGYLEFYVDFTDNFLGEIKCQLIDPRDLIIDPDARSYDPKEWGDFIIVRWMSYEDIRGRYGKGAADKLDQLADSFIDGMDTYLDRNHFGMDSDGSGFDGWFTADCDDKASRLYMVLDRQRMEITRGRVLVSSSGDVTPVDTLTPEQLERGLLDGFETVADYRRVIWSVTSGATVLHHSPSPYKTYTIVPYFPYFRRGRTRGMVCNLRSPQELENKTITNALEIQNTTANSGYDVPEGTLVNMEPEDLQKHGSRNGLVIVYRKEIGKPEKRQPTQMPSGTESLADRAEFSIKTISGMSDTLQGGRGREIAGVAIRAKAYMGETQMGRPLDNLAYTRRLAARKLLELLQQFYTEERIIRIVDPETKDVEGEVVINQVTAEGIVNDITVGTYDVVVSDTPTHATYQDGQFDQVLNMRKEGVGIPDEHVIMASSYAKKHQLVREIQEMVQQRDPVAEAEADKVKADAELKRAQARKADAETVNTSVDSKYSAIQTAGVITTNPETAPLADQILLSSGDKDYDTPPLIPPATGEVDYPQGYFDGGIAPNTNPTTPVPSPEPDDPSTGKAAGIETQRIESI
ncbi:MAG: genomic island protein [Desulfopila sp.]